MGMAASQARFLSLTARKSNVEYEGQQVNQQRTALANESANLYNKLTSIKVPTPPSTSDYYETVYTFTTSDLDKTSTTSTQYTLNNIYTMPDGTYANLSYMAYQWESAVTSAYSGDINTNYDSATGKNKISVSLANGVVAEATEYKATPSEAQVTLDFSQSELITIGKQQFELSESGSQILGGFDPDKGTYAYSYDVEDLGGGKYALKVQVKETEIPGTDDGKGNLLKELACTIGSEIFDVQTMANGTFVCTIPTDSTTEGVLPTQVSAKYVNDMGNANSAVSYLGEGFTSYNGTGTVTNPDGSISPNALYNQPILAYTLNNQTYFISASDYSKYSFASSAYVQSVGHKQDVSYPCTFTTAASGRYQSLTVTDDNGYTHQFDLTVTTVQDEEAYSQAMLDYEYEQAKYQKQVQDINAKTEKLQQEDRTLELRLKQLDTEQNAISTEMDAVQKVIEDNVESTFKTFA